MKPEEMRGKLIGERYVIEHVIGIGGLSVVYQAWDKKWGEHVAIKILKKDVIKSSIAFEGIWDEAVMTSSLSHPNIVSVHDYGEWEEGGFIVMELLCGFTLEEMIRTMPLTLAHWISLARQSLLALDHAHAMGMIHCDIKPANFVIIKNKVTPSILPVKLLDFGISQYQTELNKKLQEETPEAILGSIYYIAPELLERSKVDTRSDLYSLGHVLFHAITGVTAIADRNVNDAIESHTTGRIRKLSAMRRDLPKEICDWTHTLMETRPCDRPESAAHALQLLNALLKQMNPVTSHAHASRR